MKPLTKLPAIIFKVQSKAVIPVFPGILRNVSLKPKTVRPDLYVELFHSY